MEGKKERRKEKGGGQELAKMPRDDEMTRWLVSCGWRLLWAGSLANLNGADLPLYSNVSIPSTMTVVLLFVF